MFIPVFPFDQSARESRLSLAEMPRLYDTAQTEQPLPTNFLLHNHDPEGRGGYAAKMESTHQRTSSHNGPLSTKDWIRYKLSILEHSVFGIEDDGGGYVSMRDEPLDHISRIKTYPIEVDGLKLQSHIEQDYIDFSRIDDTVPVIDSLQRRSVVYENVLNAVASVQPHIENLRLVLVPATNPAAMGELHHLTINAIAIAYERLDYRTRGILSSAVDRVLLCLPRGESLCDYRFARDVYLA
jgi:hypothetical protein